MPISSKERRHKKHEGRKVKLPAAMQSKNWPRCPICKAPMQPQQYVKFCLNCGYTNSMGREYYFKKASEMDESSKPKTNDLNEDQYEGNE